MGSGRPGGGGPGQGGRQQQQGYRVAAPGALVANASRRGCRGPLAVLALLLQWAAPALLLLPPPRAAAQPAPPAAVSTPAELLAAVNNGTAGTIHIMRPMALPLGWGPARPARPLLIMSPFRVVLDWCDDACQAAPPASLGPRFVLQEGAAVTWNRLFFRNFLPHAPPGAAGAPRRAALLAARRLDWRSPVPFVASEGGAAAYNLVVWHFQPGMTWALGAAGATYWAAAAGGPAPAMQNMVGRTAYAPGQPAVYSIKSFALAPTSSIQECFIPMDVDGCFGSSSPIDEQLVYCPYTFKDSLKNPWLRRVLLFHDIGLDRLVNTYRDPVLVTRPVTYTSCRGTRHVLDLDNVTASVLVGTKGAITFDGLILQGSKAQNMTLWPSNIPLLLSAFRIVDSGVIAQRNTLMRVPNMASLVASLSSLPRGLVTSPDVPDLQPLYKGGAPPAPGASSFVIQSWQLDSKRYAAWTRADALPSAVALWSFANVTVQQYAYSHCYHGPVLQGSATPETVHEVSTAQQLLDRLNSNTARYIQLTANISLDPATPPNAAAVNRIVEVRACHRDGSGAPGGPGGLFEIDWGDTNGVVAVTGNLIFNGDILMKGLGWGTGGGDGGEGGLEAVVAALAPQALASFI
ncbi:MAG: hypothetical protein J3K34DRAFT_238636 [Monoraphidium minutum]|nr:MAG: hypothetical protein J3K34DRAFT_238636 [Monoraphidium minutum]